MSCQFGGDPTRAIAAKVAANARHGIGARCGASSDYSQQSGLPVCAGAGQGCEASAIGVELQHHVRVWGWGLVPSEFCISQRGQLSSLSDDGFPEIIKVKEWDKFWLIRTSLDRRRATNTPKACRVIRVRVRKAYRLHSTFNWQLELQSFCGFAKGDVAGRSRRSGI